ncbi:hypothetical protein ACFV0L_30485 [Streptosporangium canum]|uniref:hypothetical protein n=1 Tax=Streptosporangium canum TaxID=324952 RepID=UPI0036BC767D
MTGRSVAAQAPWRWPCSGSRRWLTVAQAEHNSFTDLAIPKSKAGQSAPGTIAAELRSAFRAPAPLGCRPPTTPCSARTPRRWSTPLSDETWRTYRSRVRMFPSWLADHAATYFADPPADRQTRDWAVRDYRISRSA